MDKHQAPCGTIKERLKAMYYCEQIDYYVDAPGCALCSLRFDCDARHDDEV